MSTIAQILANLVSVEAWDAHSARQLDALRFNYAARIIAGND